MSRSSRTPKPVANDPVKNYITPDGLQRLRDELRFLLTRERPAVTTVVTWAASNGDRSENADYQYGKRRLRQIDGRIRFLTKRIDAAHVVDPESPRSGRAASQVFFGATVRYSNGAGVEHVVSIVGADEVDLEHRHISWVSPLARALMKSGPGDRVALHAPAGSEDLQILEVHYRRIAVQPFSEPPGAESASKARAADKGQRAVATESKNSSVAAPPALLSGGNPQIAKAEGDGPVQAYIAAMPGWKRDIGHRLDALIARNVPNVRKAVKWNSPFYGIDGQGWFLGFHTFTNYVKVTFFQGASLRPVPSGGKGDARWINVHEDDLDEAQMTRWVMQAAALPGWATSDIRQR